MVQLVLRRPPDACFRAFVDLAAARLWVPGLKKVRVVRADAAGRPLEASFEHGPSRTYALVYAYDVERLRARWVPSAGVRDAVSGHAAFEAHPEGCLFTYALDGLRTDAAHEREVAEAFARWVAEAGGR